MGRRKRDGNHSPPKNKLVQDSEENEENGYPVPDPNKTKTIPKNSTKPKRTPRKKKSCKKSLRISRRCY
jgi:hypothetical protein